MIPGESRPALEIAVTSAAGATVAMANGADRIELCSALELGGLTPSAGLIESCLEASRGSVNVLIRCRPGDFVYSDDELDTMIREVRAVACQGVAGVVIGALDPSHTVSIGSVERIAGAVREVNSGIDITFHRAIDQAANALDALPLLADCGVRRVLSSGGAPTAIAGLSLLQGMVEARTGLEIMAGGGVAVGDIPSLLASGVDAIHLSAKRRADRRSAEGWVPLGAAGVDADHDVHFVTDAAVVAAAASLLRLP